MVMDGLTRGAVAGTSGVAPAAAPVDDDGMQCTKHPYRNNASSNGGICALCLQEKLGNLVSSSFFNGGPSSSLRSDPSAAASLSLRPAPSSTNPQDHHPTTRRARIPFLLPHRKKKGAMADHQSNLVLKRSKSAVAPRRQSPTSDDYANSTQKRSGFWSFLYHSKPKPDKTSSSSSSSVRDLKQPAPPVYAPPPAPSRPLPTRKPQRAEYVVVVDETVDDSPNHGATNATTSSFGRKVSRSRSVGCGSRSFSGDFFERISTGLGDCTLRRVESQREGKRYSSSDVIKEKVRCAGIFGGFMMTSSSSSYWLSAGEESHVNGKESSASAAHGRSRSWGWALASPMRALGRPSPSSSSSTRDMKTPASKSNGTPNLAAIPSLLTAR